MEADRQQPAGQRVGLDVERQDAQAGRPVGGNELRVLEDDAQPRRVAALALDLQGAADATVDQVAHGEAHVGLVRRDARPREAVAQRGSLRGLGDLDAHDGPSRERHLVGGRLPRGALGLRRLRVPGLDVEVRHQPAVAHQERPPILEPPVEVQDGRARFDPVGRMEDETAQRPRLLQLGEERPRRDEVAGGEPLAEARQNGGEGGAGVRRPAQLPQHSREARRRAQLE